MSATERRQREELRANVLASRSLEGTNHADVSDFIKKSSNAMMTKHQDLSMRTTNDRRITQQELELIINHLNARVHLLASPTEILKGEELKTERDMLIDSLPQIAKSGVACGNSRITCEDAVNGLTSTKFAYGIIS